MKKILVKGPTCARAHTFSKMPRGVCTCYYTVVAASNPRAHYVYLPGESRYLAGVIINRPWDQLSKGMKKCVSATVRRLLKRNEQISFDKEWR